MPVYVITYDLKSNQPDPHKPFLTEALKEGLLYVWRSTNFVNRLPNTTIWGVFPSKTAARQAFKRSIDRTEGSTNRSVTIEKMFMSSTSYSSSFVDSNQAKKPEARWTGKTKFETARLHQLNDPFFKYTD